MLDIVKQFFSKTAPQTSKNVDQVSEHDVRVAACALFVEIARIDEEFTEAEMDTILNIVAYAWGGFGAAFGPLVLFALFSRKTSWLSALLGMVVGTVVLVVWKELGLGTRLYEIVPGFLANCLTIAVANIFVPQTNPLVLKQFQEVRQTYDQNGR